jgi:dimethylargininase
MYKKAITRKPCHNFIKGLTTSNFGKPDYFLMLKQHNAYVETLQSLGLDVINLEPLNDYPDAHFIEDTAVIVPEVGVITQPGATSRRGEEITIEKELAKYKKIEKIKLPGTLDGGDVLVVDKKVFIGISARTNSEGANQLVSILDKFGYSSEMIAVSKGLHLKSDVNFIGNNTILITKKYNNITAFKNYIKIVVEKDEAYAANSLFINNKLIIPKGFPKTKTNLCAAGFDLVELEMSESQKMDGGLTCLSLRF